jgi:hypothetical protein
MPALNQNYCKEAKLLRVLYPCSNQVNSHSGNFMCCIWNLSLRNACAYIMASDLYGYLFSVASNWSEIKCMWHVGCLPTMSCSSGVQCDWLVYFWLPFVGQLGLQVDLIAPSLFVFSIGNSAGITAWTELKSVIWWHRCHESSHRTKHLLTCSAVLWSKLWQGHVSCPGYFGYYTPYLDVWINMMILYSVKSSKNATENLNQQPNGTAKEPRGSD